jgi:Mg2+-importing ATPase
MLWTSPAQEKNEIKLHGFSIPVLLLRQLKNPLLTILVVASIVSFLVGGRTDSIIILGIILLSVSLSFWNEYSAEKTVSDLLKKISLTALVVRNGQKLEIPVRDIVVGDTVFLSTGSIVPADIQLASHNNLEINESVLTGESFPVAKTGHGPEGSGPLAYMGTLVTNGTGTGQVIAIGRHTKFGQIAVDLSSVPPETQFQKGLGSFGGLLVRVFTIMALVIFIVNALLGHPIIDSILFSLAIAVGLTPELLPVVVTVSLSHGARLLAKKEVVVKHLVAIENLGNMDVICTDKTGTLTEGKISLVSITPSLLRLALLCNNAVVHHRIFGDAIDTAIWEYAHAHNYRLPEHITKVAEEPFNYDRRAMFTVTNDYTFILKGSPETILDTCQLSPGRRTSLLNKFHQLSRNGYRVIALAHKTVPQKSRYSFADAREMEFAGFISFTDIPKKTVRHAFDRLEELGVAIKIVTGDNELVTQQVCFEADIPCKKILLGSQIASLSDEKLQQAVWTTDAFARVTPEQKLRIINALKVGGHTVGFMGDGINDGPALHAADVGISVNSAVDVAKDTASVVLLRKDLSVIAEGVIEGRKIFNNTIKYILMGTSSNFGNMFSAAGASFFLPFLPMTPAQILLNNSLYDLSEITIPTDNVDPETTLRPTHWDTKLIKKYMLFFGPISSLYDFLTFGVMLFVFHARNALFQTGWFIESLITQSMVIFIIRTARSPSYRSRPSTQLTLTTIGVVAAGILLPFSPLAHIFSFVSPPPLYFGILIVMTITYLILVEIGKAHLNRTTPVRPADHIPSPLERPSPKPL